MKKMLLLISITSLIFFGFFFGTNEKKEYQINKINSYNEIESLLNQLNKETLVIFDVDDTLITSTALNYNYFSWWFKLLLMVKCPKFITNNWENLYSKMWKNAPFVLCEPLIVNCIKALKDKGVIVLALTAMESGAYGGINSMPEWRYTMLKNMSLEFSENFADTAFTELPMYRSSYPILYKGILCANRQDKGKVLKAFLNYAKIKPVTIICFDDTLSALESIADMCKENSITCQLFNYTRCKNKKWNTLNAIEQFICLNSENRWIEFDDSFIKKSA